MRALVAWADDTSTNLGVRALAQGAAALAAHAWPGVEVDFQNFGRGAAPMPVGRLRGLVREGVTGRHGLEQWLGTYDVILDTRSGDSFSDIYGLRRLARMSAFAELAARAKVPVVLAPQTIGPFGGVAGRALARRGLSTAALTMARDGESAACAAQLGRPVDVQTTDVVFCLPQSDATRDRDVVLNVSGLLWHPGRHVDAARYRGIVNDLLDRLTAKGRHVTLLAHVLDSSLNDNDVPVVRALGGQRPQLEVVIPEDLEEVRAVAASAEVVIGSRMHACLNALSVGTPAVPLAYSRKFAPLLADIGWEHTIDLRSHPDPVRGVLAAISRPGLDVEAKATRDRGQALLDRAVMALKGMR